MSVSPCQVQVSQLSYGPVVSSSTDTNNSKFTQVEYKYHREPAGSLHGGSYLILNRIDHHVDKETEGKTLCVLPSD